MTENFTNENQLLAIATANPAVIAAAETAKAMIQAAYIVALQRPRNEDQARAKILKACRRPEFAERVEFAKPVGKKKIKGASIRFAELAIREWGNVRANVQVVYEDDHFRRTSVSVIDLETNLQYAVELTIKKTVERKNSKDREVISDRLNSYGDTVYIVVATEDELFNKENAAISKAIRTNGLRLIPSDVIDEAIAIARQTLKNRDASDPDAAKKKVVDSFAGIGIMPNDLEKVIGHSLGTISPHELGEMRNMYQAINSGESTWASYLDQEDGDKKPEPPDTSKFDDLLAKKIVPDDGSFERCLEVSAKNYKMTIPQFKEVAGKDFDNFWAAYEKQKPPREPDTFPKGRAPENWWDNEKHWRFRRGPENLKAIWEEHKDEFSGAHPDNQIEFAVKFKKSCGYGPIEGPIDEPIIDDDPPPVDEQDEIDAILSSIKAYGGEITAEGKKALGIVVLPTTYDGAIALKEKCEEIFQKKF